MRKAIVPSRHSLGESLGLNQVIATEGQGRWEHQWGCQKPTEQKNLKAQQMDFNTHKVDFVKWENDHCAQ